MKDRTALLSTKLKLSAKNIGWLLSSWKYAVLAAVVAVVFFELIFWLFNASTFWTIMVSSGVSVSEKFNVLLSPFEAIGQASGVWLLSMMVILALLQGVSIAALAYVIRRQKKIDDKLVGGSSLITLLAIVGLGCPACGTSLITPIVALFVSSSAVAVSETITAFVTPLAVGIAAYGVYVLGLQIANTRTRTAQEQRVALVNVNGLQ